MKNPDQRPAAVSLRQFYTKRVSDMTSQLEARVEAATCRRVQRARALREDRARTTCTAEGHADCLSDLLVFHEDRWQQHQRRCPVFLVGERTLNRCTGLQNTMGTSGSYEV